MLIDAQVMPPARCRLTPRELKVLQLICEAHTTKQIAALLGVSHKTVACHRTRLMTKARVHSPISLFRWALETGYITIGVPVVCGASRAGWPQADW
jgi:DNA-binding NarL/FixJ family response regulator